MEMDVDTSEVTMTPPSTLNRRATAMNHRVPLKSPIRSPKEGTSRTYQQDRYGPTFLKGLTVCGVGAALLSTVFGLFYIDVFLRSYDLPLPSYASGNLVFSVINTANDVLGAWLVDATASRSSHRSELVGLSGCLTAVSFLGPFFRWTTASKWIHFVVSMSLYDSLSSFTSILLGSLVTDNHDMTDQERVRFMMSGKVVNLIASFTVARISLRFFKVDHLGEFQSFSLILCFLVCLVFVMGQFLMDRSRAKRSSPATPRPRGRSYSWDNVPPFKPKNALSIRRVISDFWNHANFASWVGMEMLLECQTSFAKSFLKTFVDRLVLEPGALSQDSSDWFLSFLSPLQQVVAILLYIPIRRIGYYRVYSVVFVTNLVLSLLCFFFGGPMHPYVTMAFLIVYTIITGAVQEAGFHLAMSDMVLEMKYKFVAAGRHDEPSLAGLFLGANSLLCRPMRALLPGVAALVLHDFDLDAEVSSPQTKKALFYLLVGPPLLFSGLQLLVWRRYRLVPKRVAEMKEELQVLYHDYSVDDAYIADAAA
uniref:ADP,ATP carrier protein n=1 Tax=Grammatophora oceanica TaxID=210454 RepID=A0A7S1VPN1_9STRA|mmetsp:Transcript_52565/g.78528  ORF Transcript_52565/g.78528 Transcript_52565/m.78528 type:complete len:536 (+) Transcript_52565:118-1725(+)|eukprot:CAMPEP_0194064858 /NCGR_PEP_ID=MMETSP0009_2-20130614/84168_1 /TAXON_ID=210454 /ORGANISM="Grammatophora oceanica, Strain CCMP 410" /LENGTH=535 /DNA_ID=CAMNT_0038717509 /DNA_START=48 /DNA_END=1655 /DNA_ORIENTATION=+